MGSAASKQPEMTLDPETNRLASKDTGTLLYFDAKDKESGGPQRKASRVEEGTFFGLDVNYEEIERHENIGQGTYGKVYKAHYQQRHIAIKEIFLSNDPQDRQEILDDFCKEIKILSLLKHECIIQFLGACRKDPHYCLLFELCEGSVGSLLNMVRKHRVNVTWRMCLKIALDCARACDYLHNLTPKILHRDLKAENLLLDDKFNCKLTDFGLSRGYEHKDVMTVCGTPCWVAPEIFRGESYDETVDIYSFSIVLWELFCFEKPYQDQDCVGLPYLVAKKNLRPGALEHCPKSLNDLMILCWHPEPTERPSFAQIVIQINAIMAEIEPVLMCPVETSRVPFSLNVPEEKE